jgi:hypothetical protein
MTSDDRDATPLAERAWRSQTAHRLAEFQMRCRLLERIVGDDIDAALSSVKDDDDGGAWAANAEYQALDDDDRQRLSAQNLAHLRAFVVEATTRVCTAAELLKLDQASIDPEHVALFAAILWMTDGPELDDDDLAA